jgi:diguanylate cyclase (GGDEF)-like protein
VTAAAEKRITAVRVIAGVALLAFVAHTLVPDSGIVAGFFDHWLYYGIEFAAVVLCVGRVTYVERNRAGWLLLCVGLVLWVAGDIYYAHWVGNQPNPPFPSPADAGYLAFYPFTYAGFILLFRERVRRLTPSVWLDGVTAALAIAALAAAIVLEVVLDATSGSLSTVATNLAYPLGDTILLAVVVGAFSLVRWQPGRAWLLLGGALTVNALGDAVYLYVASTGTYREGTLLDASWPTAMVLLANAAWVRSESRPIDAEGRPLLLLPASCTLVAVGVLVLDHFHRVNALALALAVAALACVVARLGITFRENRNLFELTRTEAITDPLTGLGNRRKLIADLDHVLATVTKDDSWLLVIFDLDGFKGYNDSFGHPAGDALLMRLGRRLGELPGEHGAAYRLGGDEFCLLASAGSREVEKLLDAAVAALSEVGDGFEIGTSFGAVFLPDDARVAREALHEADTRLYAQKHQKQSRRDRAHEALLAALHEREPALIGHTRGVAELAREAGRRLGLEGSELVDLERAAQLHDIGKIAIPDAILRKAGPLTEEEWRFIRQHTVVGERILAASPALKRVGAIVRATHERWDGTGYPDGLAGEQIPLAARVIAVCDAFDANTTARPYREALSQQEALAELKRGAGTQFDPRIVAVVADVIRYRVAA